MKIRMQRKKALTTVEKEFKSFDQIFYWFQIRFQKVQLFVFFWYFQENHRRNETKSSPEKSFLRSLQLF